MADEIETLEARRNYIMDNIAFAYDVDQASAMIDELASIETALQRYGAAMSDIGDARLEAKFGVGL